MVSVHFAGEHQADLVGAPENRDDGRDRLGEELINVLRRAQTMTPNFVFHCYKVSFNLVKV